MSHTTRQRFYSTYTLLNMCSCHTPQGKAFIPPTHLCTCVHVTRHKATVLFHLHTSVHAFMSHASIQRFYSTFTLLYMCSYQTPQSKRFIPPTHFCTCVHVKRHKAKVLFHLHTSVHVFISHATRQRFYSTYTRLYMCSCHTPQGKGLDTSVCIQTKLQKFPSSKHFYFSLYIYI